MTLSGLAGSRTSSPAFRRWFGQSVLVNPDGTPMRLYHWTPATFTKFKPGGPDPRLSGKAIWLSPDPFSAQAAHNIIHERYKDGQLVLDARERVKVSLPSFTVDVWEGTNVIAVYARVERPLMLRMDQPWEADKLRAAGLPASPYYLTSKELGAAKAAGYDGIIAGTADRPIDEVVVFSPGQVKSAVGNRGTYSRRDHDMLAGLASASAPSSFVQTLAREAPMPIEVAAAFEALGEAQRSEPENLMLRAQRVLGGGVLSVLVEHIGDLTHRMTAAYPPGGYPYVKEKVERSLRYLTNEYGFAREHDENMANNARWAKQPHAVYLTKVHVALDAYADAHEKLVVYNRAQWLARDAAVSLGRRDFKRCEQDLKALDRHLGSRDSWDKFAFEYKLGPDGKLLPYEPRGS